MKKHPCQSLIVFLACLPAQAFSQPEKHFEQPCFACFAENLREIIQNGSKDDLISIMGPELSMNDNIRYALDSEFFTLFGSDAKSMREIMSTPDLVVAIEAEKMNGTWSANIFFVPGDKLKSKHLPVVAQLREMRIMRDYVACEVHHDGKSFLFKNHFCFAETDAAH